MSPELQRLLEAYHEKLTCALEEKPRCAAIFERLLSDAMRRRPNTSREELLGALESRYAEFRRARRKPATLPPRA